MTTMVDRILNEFFQANTRGVFGSRNGIWWNWNPSKEFDFEGIGMEFHHVFG